MMIELIRNCGHGSEHATYLATDESGGRKIIKTATIPSGIKNLHNEVEGWCWYQRMRYAATQKPICRIIEERNRYFKMEIAFIDGYTLSYYKGLERNADAIRTIVRHYCDVWSRSSDPAPMHGDLSLGNIIMNSEGVHIIDWEHYVAGSVPWGFDVIYLLCETLYFGMRFRSKPTIGEIKIIREQLNAINTHHKLQADMIRNPLGFLREFMVQNDHLWGEQSMKFPILAFTPDQIAMIDKMIRSGAGAVETTSAY